MQIADFSSLQARVKLLNSKIIIRQANVGDVPRLVQLFNSHYQKKLTPDYFIWQFFNSPFKTLLVVACLENRLIGTYGIKILKVNKNIRTGFVIDILVDRKFRGRGLLYLMNNEVEKFIKRNDLDLLHSLPNQFGCVAFQRLGWKNIAKIDILEKSYFSKNFNTKDHCKNPISKTYYQIIKDSNYISYRFKQNPLNQYHILRLGSDFSITKIYQNPQSGIKYGDVVDFKCNINSSHSFLSLFIKTCNYFSNKKVSKITTWAMSHTNFFKLLTTRLSFKPVPQERYFCLKVLKKEFSNLYQFNNWHLSESDSEIY